MLTNLKFDEVYVIGAAGFWLAHVRKLEEQRRERTIRRIEKRYGKVILRELAARFEAQTA